MISEHELMTCLKNLAGAFPDRIMDDKLLSAYRSGLSDLEEGYLYLAVQDIIKTAKFFPRISEIREVHDHKWHGNARHRLTYNGEVFERLEKEHGKDRRLWNKTPKLTPAQAEYQRQRREYRIEMDDYVVGSGWNGKVVDGG